MSPLIPIFPKTKLQMTKSSMKIEIVLQEISNLSKSRKMRIWKKLVFIKLDYSRKSLKIATTIIIITIVIARKAKKKRKVVENK